MGNECYSNTIRYFFEGDFLPYRQLFQSHCPPAMKMEKDMRVCVSGKSKNWMYYLCKGTLRVYATNILGNDPFPPK